MLAALAHGQPCSFDGHLGQGLSASAYLVFDHICTPNYRTLHIILLCEQDILPDTTDIICCKFATADDTSFDVVIRVPLLEKDAVQQYLKKFQEKTTTTLRVSKTYPHVGHRLSFKVCRLQ